MPKPRSKKIRVFRLIIVSALALWCLNSLHEIHQKKQRSLARTLSDHFDHHDDGHNHDGVVGMGVWTLPRRTDGSEPSRARGGLSTLRPDIDPAIGAMTRYTSPSRSGGCAGGGAGGVAGGEVHVPEDWNTRKLSQSARKNAAKELGCLGGAPGEDDGGRFLDPVPSRFDAGDMDCKAAETIPGLCAALAELLPSGDRERAVLLAFDSEGGNVATNIARDAADTTGARAVLVVAPDAAAAAAAAAAGLPHVRPDCAGSCVRPQFAAAAAILALGADVLLVGRGAVLRGPNPLRNVPETRGADVEGIPADLNALGAVVGMSDPPMGWSQYSQSMVVPHLSSSLVVMHATEESTRLAKWLGDGGGGDGSGADADVALSEELLMPAHDATQRSGATFRVLPPKCFKAHRGGGSVADAALASPGKPWRGASSKSVSLSGEDPNDLLQSSTFEAAKSVVLRDGPIGDADENGNCAAIEQKDRVGPQPRALRYVTPPSGAFPVACDELPELCDVVSRVAINRQVLAAVSNSNILYMLGLFLDGIKASNITNTVIVALDQKTADWCKQRGAPYYHRELKSLTGSTDNHATSGLKFQVLREFLTVGASVLLSDVDVVWMRNPFGGSRLVVPHVPSDPGRVHVDQPAIYGDSDVEGMTDGWDDVSAYGFDYIGRGSVPMRRLAARNSGLFYLAATHEALRMVAILSQRMATEANTWDQTAYNEEQVYLYSSDKGSQGKGGPAPAGVTQRVMNYACFQNTKYLFRYMRYDPELYDGAKGRSLRPISVHVNYHPEKPQRMVSLIDQYLKGERDAIAKWSWSEGLASNKPCNGRPENGMGAVDASKLAKMVRERATEMEKFGVDGMWSGVKGFTPKLDGTLKTPWGNGNWGVVPVKDADGKDVLFFDFIGAKHMVSEGTLERGGEVRMISVRCTDGEKVKIVL